MFVFTLSRQFRPQLVFMNELVIDSDLSEFEAKAQNPRSIAPREVMERLIVLEVRYLSFDEKIHQGQIVVYEQLIIDVKDFFVLSIQERFPIFCVIPIADTRFSWDDMRSMQANNTSGFNYRKMAEDEKLSLHAYGLAVDVNPLLNPYIRGSYVEPPGASYDLFRVGTIGPDSFVVSFFLSRGWSWGGHWGDRKDYQHFEKDLRDDL